jgi:hypothetical protein
MLFGVIPSCDVCFVTFLNLVTFITFYIYGIIKRVQFGAIGTEEQSGGRVSKITSTG